MSKQLKHYIVTGRVQGVYFRQSTQTKASEIGITQGWVQNLPDGSVEAMAYANSDQLASFEKWLWQGPVAANVKAVNIDTIDDAESITQFLQFIENTDEFIVKKP